MCPIASHRSTLIPACRVRHGVRVSEVRARHTTRNVGSLALAEAHRKAVFHGGALRGTRNAEVPGRTRISGWGGSALDRKDLKDVVVGECRFEPADRVAVLKGLGAGGFFATEAGGGVFERHEHTSRAVGARVPKEVGL